MNNVIRASVQSRGLPRMSRGLLRILRCSLVVAALAACDDLGPQPPLGSPARRAAVLAISPESATLSSLGETTAFSAALTDQFGEAFAGTVGWSSSDPDVFTVTPTGVVSAVANGSGTVTASFEALSATAQVVVAQAPAAVVVVSGGGQEGMAGGTLAEAVVVRVDDGGGSPVEGATVTFSAAEGHGSADPATAATDAAGLARTTWTLGNAAGAQTLTASAAAGVSTDIRAAAGELPTPPDSAAYSVVFDATWSAATHPRDFPGSAHFSALIGAVHNDGVRFWASGETASAGIESMAETGGTSTLRSEIRARIPANALSVISGPGLGTSPARATLSRLVVRVEYPLVTLVTMIAPSPDWFVGVSGLSLMDEFGQWVEEIEFTLYPYDSGTDDGTSYNSANADSSPRQPIHSLRGEAPFSSAPIGTFTFTRIGS